MSAGRRARRLRVLGIAGGVVLLAVAIAASVRVLRPAPPEAGGPALHSEQAGRVGPRGLAPGVAAPGGSGADLARAAADAPEAETESADPEGTEAAPAEPADITKVLRPPGSGVVDARAIEDLKRELLASRVNTVLPPDAPAVPAGRAPRVALRDLLRDGAAAVQGTVEITVERAPEVEPGVPVALRGRVLERESASPIAGATVLVHSAFYHRAIFYDHHLEEIGRVGTDADGRFVVERLDVDPIHFGKGGLVYVSVRSVDHAPLPPLALRGVTPGYRNDLHDIVLTRERYAVRGRVLDQWEGKPVAGGRVVTTGEILPIQYPKDEREALFLGAPETVTDEEGRFVLEGVGRGTQTISVHGGDDCAGFRQIQVPVSGEVVLRTRALRGRIEGRVLDELDRPIALVRVDGGENTTHTFADGHFVLENFRGDVVTLSFSHGDYRPAAQPDVRDGSTEVVVRLQSPWPLVRFRVRDHATSEPVPLVAVQFEFGPEGGPAIPGSPFHLDASGVHAVRLPDGAVRARVEAQDHEPAEVDLTGIRDGDLVDVVLQ